jgi:hypothetical protein
MKQTKSRGYAVKRTGRRRETARKSTGGLAPRFVGVSPPPSLPPLGLRARLEQQWYASSDEDEDVDIEDEEPLLVPRRGRPIPLSQALLRMDFF